MSAAGGGAELVKRHNLTISERRAVFAELFSGSNKGVVVHGDVNRVAELFNINSNRKTIIASLWRAYQSQKDAGVVGPDIDRKQAQGQLDSLKEALAEIPIKNRTK